MWKQKFVETISKQQKCNDYTCSYLNRIKASLSYYNQISLNEPQKFIDFCDKYYSKQYLEDYIHVITVHKNDINKVEMENTKCSSVADCLSTTRHYRDILIFMCIKVKYHTGLAF